MWTAERSYETADTSAYSISKPFRLSPTESLIASVEDPDGALIELIERK